MGLCPDLHCGDGSVSARPGAGGPHHCEERIRGSRRTRCFVTFSERSLGTVREAGRAALPGRAGLREVWEGDGDGF